jgi:hypothetical protein
LARKLAVLLLVVLAGCSAERPGLDLLNAGERIKKGVVAGRGKAWIVGQGTKTTLRIGDALRRGLPAIPPSRIVYGVDIAKGSHLRFACGIAAERHDQPGVEFTVKVARSGREETVYTQLIDPANRPEHRHWVPADVDLSAWAGKDADLILETRGYESVSDPRSVVWGSPVLTPARDAAPLTVVYLVDTLRADHTSVYGYARDTTPELARFAKDGVVFENAVAQSSWTKPSVASVLTSLLPAQHGTVHLRDTLPLKLVTLGERLQDKGISTGAIVANEVIYTAGSHFEQGFDVFTGIHDPEDKTTNRATAGAVVDAALAWVDGRQGLPGFLYVHTMDPHIPYDPPPPINK